jgi:hypothetical protein
VCSCEKKEGRRRRRREKIRKEEGKRAGWVGSVKSESLGWVTAVIMTVMSHDAESSNEMMTL